MLSKRGMKGPKRGTEGSKRGAEGSKRAVKKEEDHAQCDVKKDIPYPKNRQKQLKYGEKRHVIPQKRHVFMIQKNQI